MDGYLSVNREWISPAVVNLFDDETIFSEATTVGRRHPRRVLMKEMKSLMMTQGGVKDQIKKREKANKKEREERYRP
jgi:hypothetical protein